MDFPIHQEDLEVCVLIIYLYPWGPSKYTAKFKEDQVNYLFLVFTFTYIVHVHWIKLEEHSNLSGILSVCHVNVITRPPVSSESQHLAS